MSKPLKSTIRLPQPLVANLGGEIIKNPNQHIDHLVKMVQDTTQQFLADHYNQQDLDQLTTGLDQSGRRLPKQAATIADRLGWRVPVSNSRILKMVQSNGVSILKGQAWRAQLYTTILPHLPSQPDSIVVRKKGWQTLSTKISRKTKQYGDEPTIRQLLRSATRYYKQHGQYPTTLLDMFPTPPRAPARIDLGVVDKQFATRSIVFDKDQPGAQLVVKVKLPLVETTTTARDYKWFLLHYQIPQYVVERVGNALKVSLPTLVKRKNGEYVWQTTLFETVPEPVGDPNKIIGIDYNMEKTLVATTITYDPKTLSYEHNGHVFEWDDMGLVAKNLRLQQEQELLSTKIRSLKQLVRPLAVDHPEQKRLEQKISILELERERLGAKRQRLGLELSHDAATWLRTIAKLSNAGSVYTEDLSSMPHLLSKQTNRVLSQTPIGRINSFVHHRLAREGVYHDQVSPHGTSSKCPYCLEPLTHEGYSTSVCRGCGIRAHRDYLSPVRIAQKGHAKHSRKQSSKKTRLDQPVKRGPKTGPTPKQVRSQHRSQRLRPRAITRFKPFSFSPTRVWGDTSVTNIVSREGVVGVASALRNFENLKDS